MIDKIKDRLSRNERILAYGAGRMLHHGLLQMVGLRGGFHAVWFDEEHIGLTVREIEVGVLAARAMGLDSFVRVAPTSYAIVTRCLEAGSSGVMAAQIFTAAEAEEFVSWSKFAPRGGRGLNSGGRDANYGGIPLAEFCRKANEETFVAIQIETAQSVEECDAIAAIDGVDMLFVGPADLSQGLGVIGEFMHEKCLAAIDRVAAACKKHKKHWGAVSANAEHADMLAAKGCTMISPANDVKVFSAGLESVKQEYAAFFE